MVTLGFEVAGQRLDLHLSTFRDVTSWDFEAEGRRINALHVVLGLDTILQLTEVIDDSP